MRGDCRERPTPNTLGPVTLPVTSPGLSAGLFYRPALDCGRLPNHQVTAVMVPNRIELIIRL